MKHIASSFVGAAMSRTPKAGDTCRDAGEGVCAGRTSKTNSRCRRVLLVIGMEDENLVHRRFDNRVDYIFFSRYAKSPAQRSEEHTYELKSLMRISYAVLPLQTKKNTSHP